MCQYSSLHTYVGCHVTKSKVQAGAVAKKNANKVRNEAQKCIA
jgi:hypothetical protein